jgi:hypothetical protein
MVKPQSTHADLKSAVEYALKLADEQENSIIGVLLSEVLARLDGAGSGLGVAH